MNRGAHRWSLVIGFLILVIGLVEPLQLPVPRFLPPSWQVIYLILPNGLEWLYTALWALNGVLLLAGIRWVGALRWGFRLTAFLFLSWGVAGIQAMTLGMGGNLQGSAANMVAAILAWLASSGVVIGEGLDRLGEKVQKARRGTN